MKMFESVLRKARTEVCVATSDKLGRHIVATRPYKRGDVIGEEDVTVWSAPPGFVVSTALVGVNVDAMRARAPWLDDLHGHRRPSDDQVALFEGDTRDRLVKWMTNAVQVEDWGTALSVLVALSTHSCLPNADYAVARWGLRNGDDSPRLRLVATRHIKRGEAVTVRYAPCASLPEAYGFVCGCRRDGQPECSASMTCIRALYNAAQDAPVWARDTTVLKVPK